MPLINEVIIAQINSLTANQPQLNLSQCALFDTETMLDLAEALQALPDTVSIVDLSWNFAAHKECDELALLFSHLPAGIKQLNLSGLSLHLRPIEEQLRLFFLIAPDVDIVVEHIPLQGIIHGIKLMQWIQEDFKQQSILPIALQTRLFLSTLSEAQSDEIWAFMRNANVFGKYTPWAYLASVYLASPDCNVLSPDVVRDETFCLQLIDWILCASNDADIKELGDTMLYLIEASTSSAVIKARLDTLSPQPNPQFIPFIGEFGDQFGALSSVEPQVQTDGMDISIEPASVALHTTALEMEHPLVAIQEQLSSITVEEQYILKILSEVWSHGMERLAIPEPVMPEEQGLMIGEHQYVSLRQILSNPSKTLTCTQKIGLLTQIAARIDALSDDRVFYPSLDSILMINTLDLDENGLIYFSFAPWAHAKTALLPPGIERQFVHQRMMAQFCLFLATETDVINEKKFIALLREKVLYTPGFMGPVIDLWQYSSSKKNLQESSPTLFALNKLFSPEQHMRYGVEHALGLMAGLSCYHKDVHLRAIKQLAQLFKSASTVDREQLLAIICDYIEHLVPQTTGPTSLLDPNSTIRSESWMLRMALITNVLDSVLYSSSPDLFAKVQHCMLRAGIGLHLGGALVKSNVRWSLPLLLRIVTVSVMMSVHNMSIKSRVIFVQNVRKMSKMLIDGCARKLIPVVIAHRYVGMMLVMSDFTSWLAPHDPQYPDDHALQTIWDNLECDSFLSSVLTAAPQSLSVSTIQALVTKLEGIIVTLVREKKYDEGGQKQLVYALEHLCSLAWNSVEQSKVASYKSRYTANFMELLLHKPWTTVFNQTMDKPISSLPASAAFRYWFRKKHAERYIPHASVRPQLHRLPLHPDALVNVIAEHCTSAATRYAVTCDRGGAPSDFNAVFLDIPSPGEGIVYHVPAGANEPDRNQIHSLIRSDHPLFIPQTLTSAQRICSVVEHASPSGTQGLYELHISDAGETRSLLLGMTWNKVLDTGNILPGSTISSLALDCATGCVHYINAEGEQVRYPYTSPIHSGDPVWMGISGREVYFVINGNFYPPIPNIMLPLGADIYPLVHFGSNGIKIRTTALTAQWTMLRDAQGVLVEVPVNPLAHQFYLADLRSKVCPHYHAQHNRQLHTPLLDELLQEPLLLVQLPIKALETLLFTLLAHKTCGGDLCFVPGVFNSAMNYIVRRSKEPALPAIDVAHIIRMADALELPDLVTLLQEKNKAQASSAPSAIGFFAPSTHETSNESLDNTNTHSSSNS